MKTEPKAAQPHGFTRRAFVRTASGLALAPLLPFEALGQVNGFSTRRPDRTVDLQITEAVVTIDGKERKVPTVGGSLPGTPLRFTEGEDVEIRVTNALDETSSLHWHGLLVPFDQDGVPGFSFDGIPAGETFTYRFSVRQSGTYWYHSHSGGQEQQGIYAPLIIDPAPPHGSGHEHHGGNQDKGYDREHVILLSDWTSEHPMTVLRNLKGSGARYNYGKRTLSGLIGGLFSKPGTTIRDREMWGRMRMDPTDIADVTGATYTYLLNGKSADDNWVGTFSPGERVRLRIINASAMTYFDVRIPGLTMTVVQADGQDVAPVNVHQLPIAVAETYDVIVEPQAGEVYTVFAESLDRSGFTRGTLAEDPSAMGPIPEMSPRPVRSMADMPGMESHAGHQMDGHEGHTGQDEASDSMRSGSNEEAGVMDHAAMGHEGMGHMQSQSQEVHHRLTYDLLRATTPNVDVRHPTREVTLRLTGDMERYFWTLNDKKLSDSDPIELAVGERVLLRFKNETMMEHPMHLHGVFMELQNGSAPEHAPRKHTISVPPNQTVVTHLTFDEPGPWALHCHLLYHMMTGMFVRVNVSDRVAEE